VEGGRERGSGRQVTAYEPWIRVGKTLERAAEKREKEERADDPTSGGDGPPACF